jgi:hypothetical protein
MHPPGDLVAKKDIPEMEVIMHLCRGFQYADPPAPPAPPAPRPKPLQPPLAGETGTNAEALALALPLPLPRAKEKKHRNG